MLEIRSQICCRDQIRISPGARIIHDRGEAIKFGISKIKNNDVLLIAGKGHEEFQITGNHKIPFSDRDVIESFFEASNE